MPEIYDQDQSGLFSFVPGLMLKTIIKHIGLSFLLHSRLIAHSHPAATDSGQRQMEPQLLIGGPVVLHDVRILGECADEAMMVIVGDVFFYHLHNEWYLLTVVIELHVVQLKVEDVPLPAVDGFVADAVLGLAFGDPRRPSVRLEAFLRSQGEQLVSDLLVVVLEVLQPGKLLSSPSLTIIRTTKAWPSVQARCPDSPSGAGWKAQRASG